MNATSAGDVRGRASHRLSVERLLEAECRLNASQQQPSAAKEGAVKFLHDLLLGFGIEIDHDVAAEDEIERPEGTQARAQVNRFKVDQFTNRFAQLPFRVASPKILDQKSSRQAPVHLDLLVVAGPGTIQNLRGKV